MAAVPINTPPARNPADLTTLLLLAMTRARVEPFTGNDWAAYAGAEGQPRMVHLHPQDMHAVLRGLDLDHWLPDHVTVVLDANGLSLICASPVNSYAYHVDLLVQPQSGGNPGTAEEYWQLDSRDGRGQVNARIAALPEDVRRLVTACPYSAWPYVLAGYESAAKVTVQLPPTHWLYEEDKNKWVLRARNPDGTAGPVAFRHHSREGLRQYAENNGLRPLEARTPLSAFAT